MNIFEKMDQEECLRDFASDVAVMCWCPEDYGIMLDYKPCAYLDVTRSMCVTCWKDCFLREYK